MKPYTGPMEGYRIGRAAEAIGVRVETLRRWERDGKLTTIRTTGGQRLVPAAEVARLLAERRAARPGGAGGPAPPEGGVSRRNAFPGIVTKVTRDKVSALVEIQAGPHRVVSLITREAADELELKPGMEAVATVKATSVMIEVPR
jgi:molybdopterin-binding protein